MQEEGVCGADHRRLSKDIPSLITSCVSTIKLNDPLTSDSACAITRRATVCLIW